MVNSLATESVDKQVYHHGWHHYNGHSCVGEADNQFHQHTIMNKINKKLGSETSKLRHVNLSEMSRDTAGVLQRAADSLPSF